MTVQLIYFQTNGTSTWANNSKGLLIKIIQMALDSNRITFKPKSPNGLYIRWLEEWLDNSIRRNLKSQNAFRLALDSLRKFPLPINDPKDCIMLEGFGPTLCNMISKRIKQMRQKTYTSPKLAIRLEGQNKLSPVKFKEVLNPQLSPAKRKAPQKKSPAKMKKINCDDESVLMSPNTFDVILLVDNQETSGKSKRADLTVQAITQQNIKFEVRKMSIGDYGWICRDSNGNELILPYIVERKRVDDFGSSIKDGRFHEQKFRLKQSGIENVIYLIESYGNNQHTGIPIENILQAAANTQIHAGFHVKFTDNNHESITYLAVMTQMLIQKFKDKVLISCPKDELPKVDKSPVGFQPLMKFDEFQIMSAKNKRLTAREIFTKQLVQLKSLSVKKAIAITDKYPTPATLVKAYKNCQSIEEGEKLLASIRHGPINSIIGTSISKVLYHFYMATSFQK